jgi:hypothetical protein
MIRTGERPLAPTRQPRIPSDRSIVTINQTDILTNAQHDYNWEAHNPREVAPCLS